MLQGLIKLPFAIKIFDLSVFEWLFYTSRQLRPYVKTDGGGHLYQRHFRIDKSNAYINFERNLITNDLVIMRRADARMDRKSNG